MATATSNTLTAIDGALKELYSGQVVENMVYKDRPFLAMVPKFTEFVGRNYPQPIIWANPAGASASFSGAQTYQSQSQVNEFLLTRVSDYAVAQITNEAYQATKGDKGAFLEGLKLTVDGAIGAITGSLNTALFRAGTGTICYGAYETTGDTITCSPISDIVNVEVNMPLQAASTDGGASITGDTTLGYVISVNRDTGVFAVSTSLGGAHATPTGWTNATSYYFRRFGDRNVKLSGLAAWVPATAPTATAFFGVDRSVDTTRLGGVRYDGSAQNPEEAIIDGSLKLAQNGGVPDIAVCSFATYASLQKSLGAKVVYVDAKSPAGIAFRGIEIHGGNSAIKVFPDRACPSPYLYLLQLDTWKLRSLGECPGILKYEDGLMTLRAASSDAIEIRAGYYAQLGCSAPGYNASIKMPV